MTLNKQEILELELLLEIEEFKNKKPEIKVKKLSPRQIAESSGDKHYFTGQPCKKGHIEPRLVSSKECVVCHKNKEWNRNNPNKPQRN